MLSQSTKNGINAMNQQEQKINKLEECNTDEFISEIKLPLTSKSQFSMINFDPKLPGSKSEKILINRSSLPKLLIGGQKKNQKTTNFSFKNKAIDDFINRFDRKNANIETPKHREGTNGWKLVQVKKSKLLNRNSLLKT